MKKKVLLFSLVAIACLIITGCGKKEETKDEKKEENNQIVGGWETIFSGKQVELSEEKIEMFNSVKEEYEDLELEPIAIIGRQVVAGKNYMFLAKGYKKGEEENATYKMVVVYKDLDGNAKITNVTYFDYTKYVNKNADADNTNLAGGWYSDSPSEAAILEEKIESAFDKATSTLTGMTFKPITALGKQIVSGTNYAILCYGEPSVKQEDSVTNVYVVTIYEDLNGNSEFKSSRFVSLSEYNK